MKRKFNFNPVDLHFYLVRDYEKYWNEQLGELKEKIKKIKRRRADGRKEIIRILKQHNIEYIGEHKIKGYLILGWLHLKYWCSDIPLGIVIRIIEFFISIAGLFI